MVVKIRGPFWVPIIIRHLIFKVSQKGTRILTTPHIDIAFHTGICMAATLALINRPCPLRVSDIARVLSNLNSVLGDI